MSTANQPASTPMNPLEMSDEDFLNADPSHLMHAAANEAPEAKEEEDAPEESQEAVDEEAAPEEEVEEAPEDEEAQPSQEEGDESQDEAETGEQATETQSEKADEASESKIDYEAEYNRLFSPIKANGREVKLKSMDDAIALIQMGINYNKKMAGLKPHLKVLKTLEKHQLLDEQKLGFIIDLVQKKPGAIEKFMKDSGIDPMDIDAEKADSYTPGNHTVDDLEVELDQVIQELEHTPTFGRTASIVTSFDPRSKEEIRKFPEGLKVLNAHVESGIYDMIIKEVENERLLGRLRGLSDLEAYRQVGDALHAQGAFNQLGRQSTTQAESPKIVVPNPKKEDDSKLRQKRRAASPTKANSGGTVNQEFNPLALSDEEFSKLSQQHFL